MYSLLKFLKTVVFKSKKLRLSFISAATSSDAKIKTTIENNFSVLILAISCLGSISYGKPFHDLEYQLVKQRMAVYIEFFKNLNENNFSAFKKYFNTFQPQIKGTPTFNSGKLSAIRVFDKLTEPFVFTYNSFQSVISLSPRLATVDKPELIQSLCQHLRLQTELCSGPSEEN